MFANIDKKFRIEWVFKWICLRLNACQDKLNPFCTSVLSGGSSSVEKTEIKRKGDEKRHNVLDKGVFEQFKQTNTGKRDASDLLESHGADSFEESRKRQHLNSSMSCTF